MPSTRRLKPEKGRICANEITLSGTITIGAAGAISAQTGALLSGAVATKTASETGRYSVAFYRSFKRLKSCGAWYEGPADAAFPTTTGAIIGLRNCLKSGFDIQAARPDTMADTNPASGTILHWVAVVAES